MVYTQSTCGSWCISGSIWGLRKGNRHTVSPCLRRYSCPLAMRSLLSCITSLLIITAAVSRRVSLRTLSAERRGHWEDDLRGVSVGVKSAGPSGVIWRCTNICTNIWERQSSFYWIKGRTLIVTDTVSVCLSHYSQQVKWLTLSIWLEWLNPEVEELKWTGEKAAGSFLHTKHRCAVSVQWDGRMPWGRILGSKTSDLWLHSLHGRGVSEQEAKEPKGSGSSITLKREMPNLACSQIIF